MLVVKDIDESILIGTRADIICNIARQTCEFPTKARLLPGETRPASMGLNIVEE